jgi:hypothetical protein
MITEHIRDGYIREADEAQWATDLKEGLSKLRNSQRLQSFDLTIGLAHDTSNVAWAETYGNREQKARASELFKLVEFIKDDILPKRIGKAPAVVVLGDEEEEAQF